MGENFLLNCWYNPSTGTWQSTLQDCAGNDPVNLVNYVAPPPRLPDRRLEGWVVGAEEVARWRAAGTLIESPPPAPPPPPDPTILKYTNVFGEVSLSELAYAFYMGQYEVWQRAWLKSSLLNPEVPWYQIPNPPGAEKYPPGFLEPGLRTLVIYTGGTILNDGFLWCQGRTKERTGINSYAKLNALLKTVPKGAYDRVIISGHGPVGLNHSGVSFNKANTTIGGPPNPQFDEEMPDETASLLRNALAADGILLLAGCGSGKSQAAIDKIATRIGHAVSGAMGGCSGVVEDDEEAAIDLAGKCALMGGWADQGWMNSWKQPTIKK